jgi:hypothetical protein
MVAYNFLPQFAEAVASGKKTQTIRKSLRAKPGDKLQLYTGQHTKECRKLVEQDPVVISIHIVRLALEWAEVDGKLLEGMDLDLFAIADGFPSYEEMTFWFGLDSEVPCYFGSLVKWEMPSA